MDQRSLKKIDTMVMAWGAVFCCTAVFFWDFSIILGAFLGAVLALINWIGFRSFMLRLLTAKSGRGRIGVLLGLKTLMIFVAVAVVLILLPVHIVAFIIGLSSLVVGIMTQSFFQMLSEGEAVLKKDSENA